MHVRKIRLILAAIVLLFGGFLNYSYGQSIALEGPSHPGKEIPSDVGQILSVVRLVETEYFHPSNEIVLTNAALKGIESFLKARKLLAGPIKLVSPSGVADQDLIAFSERYSRIKGQYSARVKEKELVHAAIRGVVSSLKDPYTVFMDSKEYNSLTEQMSGGNFGGIGIYIELTKVSKGSKASRLLVGESIEGTPAFRAGLKTGDMIEKINGKSTRGVTVEGAQHLIRGPVGTRVTLTVRKKNELRPIEVILLRENIRIPSVKHRMLESNVGYVRLRTFGDQTPRELEKAMEDLEAGGAKGYILDLRNNGGGYITTALSVCSRFLPGGSLIVSVVDRKGRKTSYFADGSMHQSAPVIVLVNHYSASASEITAAALQDNGAGKLVGVKTYGKGTVQSIYPLSDGSAVKLTVAHYVTPNGEDIHKKGISPDIPVEVKKEVSSPSESMEGADRQDIQLRKAIDLMSSELAKK